MKKWILEFITEYKQSKKYWQETMKNWTWYIIMPWIVFGYFVSKCIEK